MSQHAHPPCRIEELEQRILRTATDDKIIFYSADRQPAGIYTASADGSNVQNIPVAHGGLALDPVFSPDESKILFTADPGGQDDSQFEIFIANPDGSGETQLTNNSAFDGEATFTPDGGQIIFVSKRSDNNRELWMMNADGSEPVRLTNTQAEEANPVVHPSGLSVMYEADDTAGEGDLELYSFGLRDGQTTQMTHNAADDSEPAFSPDGFRVAFISDREDAAVEVYDGDATNPDVASRLTIDTFSEISPSYSPDGETIAFSRGTPSSDEIVSIATSGVGMPQVILTGFHDEELQWSSSPEGAVLTGSHLTIWGTGDADNISLNIDGENLEVNFHNGVGPIFTADVVNTIDIYLREGDDQLFVTGADPDDPDRPSVQRVYCLGGAGDDLIIGGDGNDTLTGSAGRNTIVGGNGDDRLNGSGGRDFIDGGGGNDRVYGNGGNDYLTGGGNIDRIWGGDGDDYLFGNGQNDKLFGEAGSDQLFGGDGNDILDGGPNADFLNGQKGTDAGNADPEDELVGIETF